MLIRTKSTKSKNIRKGEEGAALITALLISFLMLVASAGLLLESSMNTQNVTDATAEQEAYNAAESGIQSAVNVLRYKCTAAVSPCKVRPTPLLNPALADYNKANTINYSRALSLTTSNAAADASTAPRLSRWIGYDSVATDRVKLGDPTPAYNANNGYAYSLEVSDPDNTGSAISLSTSGRFFEHDAGNNLRKSYPSPTSPDRVVVEYTPASITNLTVPAGSVGSTNFGTFTYTKVGNGALIPAMNRFEIVMQMSVPFTATRVVRGWIMQNASPYTTPPRILFDSKTYDLRGSDVTFTFLGSANGSTPYGYETPMPASGVGLDVAGTISSPQPARLLVKSTGYGPRGAVKQLEAIIQNNYFDGLGAPATITLVGPASTTNPNTTFRFDPGNSNAMLYSGEDVAAGSSDVIPPIGVTGTTDPITGTDPTLDAVLAAVGGNVSNNVRGTPSNVTSELPRWLSSPATMDMAVRQLYNVALNSSDPTNPTGRYFPSGTQPTTFGDNTTAQGITFCDGDCELGPVAGGGILIVTGQLTLRGNFSFNGLIIVTGQGGVLRNGGGNGTIRGNIVIAPYVNSAIAGNLDPAAGATFLAPSYQTQGGGNSTITYDSNNQMNGLGAVSNVAMGVMER